MKQLINSEGEINNDTNQWCSKVNTLGLVSIYVIASYKIWVVIEHIENSLNLTIINQVEAVFQRPFVDLLFMIL